MRRSISLSRSKIAVWTARRNISAKKRTTSAAAPLITTREGSVATTNSKEWGAGSTKYQAQMKLTP